MPGSKRLIIAFFENPAAAEVAARAMERRLAVTEREVDGVVGLLSLDPTGRVITAKLGRRVGDDGPGVGAVLGFIALAMTATALPASGELLDARSELSTDDVARLGAGLDSGLAAVAVLEPRGTVGASSAAFGRVGRKGRAASLDRAGNSPGGLSHRQLS